MGLTLQGLGAIFWVYRKKLHLLPMLLNPLSHFLHLFGTEIFLFRGYTRVYTPCKP
jgi:hypothetical protein